MGACVSSSAEEGLRESDGRTKTGASTGSEKPMGHSSSKKAQAGHGERPGRREANGERSGPNKREAQEERPRSSRREPPMERPSSNRSSRGRSRGDGENGDRKLKKTGSESSRGGRGQSGRAQGHKDVQGSMVGTRRVEPEGADAALAEADGARGNGDAQDGGPAPARRFKYKELQVATNNFSEDRILGEGSFGKVYEGELDEGAADAGDGYTVLAVKKLNPESFQGYEEWLAEVLLLDKLRHPNLVRLVGYCAERGEALLAYELCPNGSLDGALFEGKDGFIMSWPQRVRVAQDAARGLAYLHQNNVIHRDFKPSNILLAEDYSGRLTDFGMARAGPDGGETHISTRVMGTMGYLDPAYMETGRLTRRSDTYAFGVMLLELLTGRRSMGEDGGESLTSWVTPLLRQRKPNLKELVDPRLEDRFSRAGAVKMAILAKHCIQDDPHARPEMSTLAENLELVDASDS